MVVMLVAVVRMMMPKMTVAFVMRTTTMRTALEAMTMTMTMMVVVVVILVVAMATVTTTIITMTKNGRKKTRAHENFTGFTQTKNKNGYDMSIVVLK